MDKTLGCLVASMTFGSLVLYYTQPELPATQGEPRYLIAEPIVWHAIHLDPEIVNEGRPTSPAHFYVDHLGGSAPTPLWTGQKRLAMDRSIRDEKGREIHASEETYASGHVIRIGLITPPGSHEITPEQQAKANLLIEDLGRRFGITQDSVIWDDTLNIPNPQPTPTDLRPDASRSR